MEIHVEVPMNGEGAEDGEGAEGGESLNLGQADVREPRVISSIEENVGGLSADGHGKEGAGKRA